MFQTKVVEAIKRHIFVFNNFFFRVVPSIRLCGKYCRARQVTDNNMHMNFMLDTSSYRHTLRMCDTYCFSTATMVVQTSLRFML